jgi:hypothetical protein
LARYPQVDAVPSRRIAQTITNVCGLAQGPGFCVRRVGTSFSGRAAAALAVAGVCIACRPRRATRQPRRADAFIHDVVPFEDAPGLVAADKHGYLFRDTPARTRFLTRVLLRPGKKPVNTGSLTAFSQAFRMSTTGWPRLADSPRRSTLPRLKNTHGNPGTACDASAGPPACRSHMNKRLASCRRFGDKLKTTDPTLWRRSNGRIFIAALVSVEHHNHIGCRDGAKGTAQLNRGVRID